MKENVEKNTVFTVQACQTKSLFFKFAIGFQKACALKKVRFLHVVIWGCSRQT